MNITTKLVLRKDRPKKDGSCPALIRLTINRVISYINTGEFIHPDYWNETQQNVKKTVNNFRDLHLFFETWKSNIHQAILLLKNKKQAVNREAILDLLMHGEQSDDFIEFVAKELAEHGNRYSSGTLRHYKSKLAKLKSYQNPINMHMMDYNFLKGYKKYLEETIKTYSTVHAHLKFVRAMNNEAIRQGITNNYAFKKFSLPDPKSAPKEFLVREERDKLWALLYANSLPGYLQKTLHYFLIACYTGLRESDWNECRKIKNDIITAAQKKKGGKVVRIPLNKFSKQLIMDLPAHYRVFSNTRNNIYLKEIMQLAQIDKHITTHCGRHTFVVMCLNEAKIPFKMVSEFVDDTVETLEKHYARYLDSFKKDEMKKLDDL